MRPGKCRHSRFFCRLTRGLGTRGTPASILRRRPNLRLCISFTNSALDCVSVRANRVVGIRAFISALTYASCTFILYIPSRGARSFLCTLQHTLRFCNNIPGVIIPSGLGTTIAETSGCRPAVGGTVRSVNGRCNFIIVPYRPTGPARGSLMRGRIRVVCRQVCTELRRQRFFSLSRLGVTIRRLLIERGRAHVRRQTCAHRRRFRTIREVTLQILPRAPCLVGHCTSIAIRRGNRMCLDYSGRCCSIPCALVNYATGVVFATALMGIFIGNGRITIRGEIQKCNCASLSRRLTSGALTFAGHSTGCCVSHTGTMSRTLYTLVRNVFTSSQTGYPPRCCCGAYSVVLELREGCGPSCFSETYRVYLRGDLFAKGGLRGIVGALVRTTSRSG